MDAMDYEFLIRMVNNCGRDASKGADTEFYTRMAVRETNLQTKILFATDEERQHEFENAFNTVRRHVKKAIEKGLDKIKYKVTEREKMHLEFFARFLNTEMYNRKKLDEIIEEATEIFLKYNLRSG